MERKSNIELLRIVAMLSVIALHLGGAMGIPRPGSSNEGDFLQILEATDWKAFLLIAMHSIPLIGVNCFAMISGYFGIHARLGGFCKFIGMCLFYSVGIYLITMIPDGWDTRKFIESWMIFSHNDLWYVPAYMILYALSPMLNAGTERLDNRSFGLWLGVLVAMNVWGGWWEQMKFNQTGYTAMQLIMMYLIGSFLRRMLTMSHRQWRCGLWMYVGGTVATITAGIYMNPLQAYAYNAPWTMLSSVGLFVWFCSLEFKSKIINRLAKGAFAAYLIHKNPAVWVRILKPMSIWVWRTCHPAVFIVYVVLFSVAIYLASAGIDALRVKLLCYLKSPMQRVSTKLKAIKTPRRL